MPDGMTSQVHTFEAREGGSIRVSLTYDEPDETGKTTAHTDTYHGRFEELVPNERVVEVDPEFRTADPTLQGEMTITVTLAEAEERTEIVAVHDGLPPGVTLAANELGWRLALDKLAALVEAAWLSTGWTSGSSSLPDSLLGTSVIVVAAGDGTEEEQWRQTEQAQHPNTSRRRVRLHGPVFGAAAESDVGFSGPGHPGSSSPSDPSGEGAGVWLIRGALLRRWRAQARSWVQIPPSPPDPRRRGRGVAPPGGFEALTQLVQVGVGHLGAQLRKELVLLFLSVVLHVLDEHGHLRLEGLLAGDLVGLSHQRLDDMMLLPPSATSSFTSSSPASALRGRRPPPRCGSASRAPRRSRPSPSSWSLRPRRPWRCGTSPNRSRTLS